MPKYIKATTVAVLRELCSADLIVKTPYEQTVLLYLDTYIRFAIMPLQGLGWYV